jgi:hypothetical protein
MYRFNGSDGRLERLLECTMMVMEALDGFGDTFEYAVIGHSGDAPQIPFVDFGSPPVDRKARLAVLQKMAAHSQFCWSGDHTLEAAEAAVRTVREENNNNNNNNSNNSGGEGSSLDDNGDGDLEGADAAAKRHFVFLLSDANLKRYRLDPAELGEALSRDPLVEGQLVMIASLADEASKVQRAMPPGTASVCLNASDLPQLIKTILTASIDVQ